MKNAVNHYIGELSNDLLAMNDEINAIKMSIEAQTNKHLPVDGATSMVRLGIVLAVRKRTEEVIGKLQQVVAMYDGGN